MDQMFKNKLDWGIQVARGNILNAEVTHRFGMATVGTTFVPIADGLAYRTPQAGSATALRIKAGGNANDTAAGTGARSVRLTGLNATGVVVSETIATAGASASAATTATFIRLFDAEVVDSGTYGTQDAGSHAADIVIDFDDDLPAGAVLTGWGIYGKVITFNPAITAGLRLSLLRPWAGALYLPVYNATYTDSDQDYRPDGAWITPTNVEDAVNFDNTAVIWPNFAAPPQFSIATADALTLTNLVTELDMWVYVIYSVPVAFEFPPA